MKDNVITIEMEYKDNIALKSKIEKLMQAAKDKRATDIVAVHVGEKTIVAEWFVFMSGTSQIHVKAVCDEIEKTAADIGLDLRRCEGYNEGRWIVLDFSNILVHIFHPEEREYYNVERLWIDPSVEVVKIKD